MLKIKNLRGECQHCGEPIEFHAEHTGNVADCPHCGRPTELLLPAPPEEGSFLRRKILTLVIAGIVILIAGLIAANVALKRAKRLQERRQQNSELKVSSYFGEFAVQLSRDIGRR